MQVLFYLRKTAKCIVALDDETGKERWLDINNKEIAVSACGNFVEVSNDKIINKAKKVGNYADNVILYDEEMYDNAYLKINTTGPNLKKIIESSDTFVKLLRQAISNDEAKKLLASTFDTRVVHLGCTADRVTMYVDGEIMHKA